MKMLIGQLTQLKKFCNGNNVNFTILQVINRISSCKKSIDIITALNNPRADIKPNWHFRTFSHEEDFLSDNVHMKDCWYVNAGFDLVKIRSSAPEARPDLVDLTCFQCVQFEIQVSQLFQQ